MSENGCETRSAQLLFTNHLRAGPGKRHLSTYLDGTAVQQPEPKFLNENGPIKPNKSEYKNGKFNEI